MYLYWHIPVWQALLLGGIGLVLFGWLLMRVWLGNSVGDALHHHAPAINQHICFYYSPDQGLQALSDAAEKLNQEAEGALDDRFWDAVMETVTEGRHVMVEGWPQEDDLLIALPIEDEQRKGWHVLAFVIREATTPTSPPSIDDLRVEPLQNEVEWIKIHPDVWMHHSLPQVRVRQRSQDENGDEAAFSWQVRELSVTEHQLLQFLYAHAGEVQSAEALFSALWPTDPVDSFGLRPEQKDRVRRAVFQLRRKIEPVAQSPQIIRTAHGVGYALYCSEEMEQ